MLFRFHNTRTTRIGSPSSDQHVIRVGVIDDSDLMRRLLREIIDAEADMRVVATANNVRGARAMIKSVNPDVVTLDVEMPGMNGIEFLEHLMVLRPMPVIMVSSLTVTGADTTLRALELGALDVMAKSGLGTSSGAADLVEKLRAAKSAKVRAFVPPQRIASIDPAKMRGRGSLLLFGASTGGTEAIAEILAALPADIPPVVITQHMPPLFTTTYAQRLDRLCAFSVHEAVNGEPLQRGRAYLAPGGLHLLVEQHGAGLRARLSEAPPVERHRPSVDVLFSSAAAVTKGNAIAALLTGMGRDGACGLRDLRDAGAFTIAQDEESSVVFGMPKVAIDMGAADTVLPLQSIASTIVKILQEPASSADAARS